MSTPPSQLVRLVSKDRYDEQHWVEVPAPSQPVADSSVRVQPTYVALTSNTLAYVAFGDVLHWWSAFELPAEVPAEYNDAQKYVIAPGWGYGRVIESTVPGIPKDAIIAGFTPVSGHTFDLSLEAAGRAGDYVDVTKSRSSMMTLYHRYTVLPPGTDVTKSKVLTWQAVLKVWEAGYNLAKYVFPAHSSSYSASPVHPVGLPVSPWTSSDADLSDSMLVVVASGTKTARSFLETLSRRKARDGVPKIVVEITSGKGATEYTSGLEWRHELITYDNVSKTDIFKQISPDIKKAVILEFGGREGTVLTVFEAVSAAMSERKVIVVNIGSEAKVHDNASKKASADRSTTLEALLMNASGIKDAIIAKDGEPAAFEDAHQNFVEMVERQSQQYDGKVLGVRYAGITGGLRGEDGVEGAWRRLTAGAVSGDDALLFRLD